MKFCHEMFFGARVLEGMGVTFSLWAPSVPLVVLVHGELEQEYFMTRDENGWHRFTLLYARAGDTYRFRMPDGLLVPDPASRSNPEGVHGPSVVVDPNAYEWQHEWKGRPWQEAVIYELHVGCFTPEGTFAAAAKRLPALAQLGITAIELMPIAAFPGKRSWGYDGVLHYAPAASYGTPDELKAFVDAAHGLNMMVMLDVVYNHFGPEGNYLHAYCPEFFNPEHQTPWGSAINFDAERSRGVRDFFLHNAIFWLQEYQFDGLRMDAIHAICDTSVSDEGERRHIVNEISDVVGDVPGDDREIHVVVENDANQAFFLEPSYTDEIKHPPKAQWNDDLHHAAHVLTTGETDGYYVDYADDPLAQFGRALARGFIYQGQPSAFRNGEPRGEDSSHLPLHSFVSYLQTHDQIGNRAFGERIHAIGDTALVRAAWACILFSPHVPMFFMGDEFEASTPFLYFCDFGPELAGAVSDGRRAEFGRFALFGDEAARSRIPDPNAASTFEASKLRWEESDDPSREAWRAQVGKMLAQRQRWLVPLLERQCGVGSFHAEGGLLRVDWTLADTTKGQSGPRLHLVANFGDAPAEGIPAPSGRVLHADAVEHDEAADTLRLARAGVFVTLQE
ncbi:malto-oligosyltrehalose trehalohydrolase [Variovorax sp. KK3]|uniref:malto-oligosyltrehalose trehalohydrolase n=1 Tax=Variovorax sp. KK3 TaxID=1855728 RepID=UPI00097BDA20|nr:malto-oligosyltrehalose trehalohydrolase [Variovorax sp. KK3]